MKTMITERNEITGKDGREWRVYNGITRTGKPVRLFLSANDEHKFKLSERVVVDAETVQSAFDNSDVIVDVEYDERGRVAGVTVEGGES